MTITWGMVILGCAIVGLCIGLILRFLVRDQVMPGETFSALTSLAFFGACVGVIICLIVAGVPYLWRLPLF